MGGKPRSGACTHRSRSPLPHLMLHLSEPQRHSSPRFGAMEREWDARGAKRVASAFPVFPTAAWERVSVVSPFLAHSGLYMYGCIPDSVADARTCVFGTVVSSCQRSQARCQDGDAQFINFVFRGRGWHRRDECHLRASPYADTEPDFSLGRSQLPYPPRSVLHVVRREELATGATCHFVGLTSCAKWGQDVHVAGSVVRLAVVRRTRKVVDRCETHSLPCAACFVELCGIGQDGFERLDLPYHR